MFTESALKSAQERLMEISTASIAPPLPVATSPLRKSKSSTINLTLAHSTDLPPSPLRSNKSIRGFFITEEDLLNEQSSRTARPRNFVNAAHVPKIPPSIPLNTTDNILNAPVSNAKADLDDRTNISSRVEVVSENKISKIQVL